MSAVFKGIEAFGNHLPVRIRFGEGVAASIADILEAEALRRPCLIIDDGLERMNPAAARKLARLREALPVTVHVKPAGEPDFAMIDDAARAAAECDADSIVAVGGGSTMDTAKAARLSLAQGRRISEIVAGLGVVEEGLPLICVPTTAGTGSEVSGGAVLLDPETHVKAGIAHPNIRATFAVVDPELTHSSPRSVTVASGVDALAQAVAALLVKTRTPIGDALGLEATRLIGLSLRDAAADGSDTAARSRMACGSLLAGLAMNISDCGAEHSLGQALGARYGLPHGLTVALVMVEAFDRERQFMPETMERVADALGVPAADGGGGERAIDGLRALLRDLGVPTMREAGVSESDVDLLAAAAMNDFFHTQSTVAWTVEEMRACLLAGLELEPR